MTQEAAMTTVRRAGAALLAALALVPGAAAAQGATAPGCAGAAPGGDWPMYGGTLDNHRDQTAEQAITPANVSQLHMAWKRLMPDKGTIQATPVVADGCVFTGTSLGAVEAVNADTGAVVWKTLLGVAGGNALAGAGIVGAPAVADGLVYIGITTPKGAIEAALDEATGTLVWTKTVNADPRGAIDSHPPPLQGKAFHGHE